MDSFVATNKGKKKIMVSLDDKAVIERYNGRVKALDRFTARKYELKKEGYYIQHIGVETVQGKRIEKSKPIQRQKRVKVLGRWVNA